MEKIDQINKQQESNKKKEEEILKLFVSHKT
jgi:hypothetical protein